MRVKLFEAFGTIEDRCAGKAKSKTPAATQGRRGDNRRQGVHFVLLSAHPEKAIPRWLRKPVPVLSCARFSRVGQQELVNRSPILPSFHAYRRRSLPLLPRLFN